MKGFARLVAQAHFWGKTKIRPATFQFYQSVTKSERWKNYRLFMPFLAILVIGHAIHAVMGVLGLWLHPPIWVKIVFVLYIVVNLSVSLIQAYLMFRATVFLFTGKYPRRQKRYPEYTMNEELTMISITLPLHFFVVVLFLVYVWMRLV